jgi:hypothetical protein
VVSEVATQNTQLQRLDLKFVRNYLLSDQLQTLLTACPGMTDLAAHGAIYESEDLEFLMQHATHLTSLRGCGFDIRERSWAGEEWPGMVHLHMMDLGELHLEMVGHPQDSPDAFH